MKLEPKTYAAGRIPTRLAFGLVAPEAQPAGTPQRGGDNKAQGNALGITTPADLRALKGRNKSNVTLRIIPPLQGLTSMGSLYPGRCPGLYYHRPFGAPILPFGGPTLPVRAPTLPIGVRTLLSGSRSRGFTLLELLIVITIIAVLATIGLPALKGFGQSNAIYAANRQMLDDLARARLYAINNRSTVYVLFASPNLVQYSSSWLPGERPHVTNLINGQYTSYAIFTKRTLGDQPGQEHPRFLTEWQHLPEGVFIDTNKFNPLQAQPPWPTETGRTRARRRDVDATALVVLPRWSASSHS